MSLNVIISLFQATLDDMEDNLLVGSNNFTQPREFDLLQVEKIITTLKLSLFLTSAATTARLYYITLKGCE